MTDVMLALMVICAVLALLLLLTEQPGPRAAPKDPAPPGSGMQTFARPPDPPTQGARVGRLRLVVQRTLETPIRSVGVAGTVDPLDAPLGCPLDPTGSEADYLASEAQRQDQALAMLLEQPPGGYIIDPTPEPLPSPVDPIHAPAHPTHFDPPHHEQPNTIGHFDPTPAAPDTSNSTDFGGGHGGHDGGSHGGW